MVEPASIAGLLPLVIAVAVLLNLNEKFNY